MGKNIVVLSGSPRRGATTDRLTNAFIEGAISSGNSVSCFRVADMRIGGCRGCRYCFDHYGVCVQDDDMTPILDALRAADVLVLASPVYYFGVTAQLKLAIDRTYALLRRMPVKQALLLMTCGAGPEAASPSVSMFRQICALQNWEEVGIVVAPRLHKPEEIEGREELNQARLFGQILQYREDLYMNVAEALFARHSTRAFLSKPIEKDKLNIILEAAVRTPSWANSQPWEIFIATGKTLDRIKRAYLQKYADNAAAAPETPRPTAWSEAARKRQQRLHPDMVRDCGTAVDQFGSLNQNMFNAPVVIYICMDKILSQWSLYDIGAYSQSLMLAAVEQGLATIPAITLMHFPEVLRKELCIPENLKLTIGIALGYADRDNPINNFISGRDPLCETVHFCE